MRLDLAPAAAGQSSHIPGRSGSHTRRIALMESASEHERGILDTTTLILLPRLRDTVHLPAEPLITAVTLAELTVGPLVASTDAERAARLADVQQAEADFDPLPFDAVAARARALARRARSSW
ncbi:MAG: hypothetical protein ACT4O1_13070 [Gemmatimonadota bacterium]